MFEFITLIVIIGLITKYYMAVIVIVVLAVAAAFFSVASRSASEKQAFTTLMPYEAVNEIRNGRLPRLNMGTIVLAGGEYCHYFDKAKLQMNRIVKSWHSTGNLGGSYS